MVSFFFFNDTATTEIYTLSLHDALPILEDCKEVVELMSNGWEEKVGGQLVFEPDYEKILEMVTNRIQEKREALGIQEEKERVLMDMAARREI